MPLRIHNTLTNAVEPVAPADPSRVTFYTCGPTVYDDAHIGNFRSFLAADLLRRWLESPLCELTAPDGSVHAGPRQVVHVMNITDVGHMTDDDDADGAGEDKMVAAEKRLRDAKKAGTLHVDVDIDPSDQTAIARFYADRFLDDARRLGLKVAIEEQADPSLMPRASDNVPGMIEMIESLIEKDHAYAVGEPGSQTVYFDVRSFASYGRLSGNTIEDVRSGAGGRVTDDQTAQKKHPADFLLWKADPSHKMKWPSPWGEGYPGWHIECSVMALARLDPDSTGIIDLHSGGEDNIFPHHECERAQSCSATGADRFARHWFHPRFLIVEGQKMSKSKGNFFTARELFDKGHEPAAVRLELIKTHYRTNANFTEQGLKDSARMIERWRKARMDIARCSMGWKDAGIEVRKAGSLVNNGFAATLNDDLNIAAILPPESRHCENARMRRTANPRDKWGDYTNVEVARAYIAYLAKKHDFKVYASFETALDDLIGLSPVLLEGSKPPPADI